MFTRAIIGSFALLVSIANGPAQTLTFSTYYGGQKITSGLSVTTDAGGNAYQISDTSSSNMSCSGSLTGRQNILISKFSADGSLDWCEYFGGTGTDYGNGIALDGSGNIYFTGATSSPNLGTAGAFQSTLEGVADAFLGEMDSSGNLLWFTYLGTMENSESNSVFVDSTGAIYITGYTTTGGWPVAGSVSQTKYGGGPHDIVAAKVNPGGSTLAWSGYFGGLSDEEGYRIVLPADEAQACLVGYTSSGNYPTSPGAFQKTKGAVRAGVVTCVDATAGTTESSTYFGGASRSPEPCNACIAGASFDADGNLWIVGLAQNETGFPITPNALYPEFAGGPHDAFICELDRSLATVEYCTWFGGGQDDGAVAIAFDAAGNLWAHGNTFSDDLPVTQNAFQMTNGGPATTSDEFLVELSPSQQLLYSTYLGGSKSEYAGATQNVAISATGVWMTGWTNSPNFPLVNPIDNKLPGNQGAFLSEFAF